MDTDINLGARTCPSAAPGGDSATTQGRHRPVRPASVSASYGGAASGRSAIRQGAPNVSGLGLVRQGGLLTNFNGISDVDSHTANGFHDTPPDQGLCVGRASSLQAAGVPLAVAGNTTVVLEGVNSAWSVYSTSGAPLFGPDTLVDLFNDPGASGDISCQYEPTTQTFYFTEIGVQLTGPDIDNFNTDLAVISPSGYAAYQIDTSVGGTCFPDFPHHGYDNNAFYLTINQFCGASQAFAGSMIWAFSKSQLVALNPSVNVVVFGPIFLSGIAVQTMAPAFGDFSNVEYLANAFARD